MCLRAAAVAERLGVLPLQGTPILLQHYGIRLAVAVRLVSYFSGTAADKH